MTAARIRDAGDSALLLQLDEAIAVGLNERAIGIAEAVRREGIAGVRDVVAAFRSVAVYFDPLHTEVARVRRALEHAEALPISPKRGRTVEVPVAYGAEYGPDLEEVAGWAGLTPSRVIERHAAPEYRVFMLGFLPGFAYLGRVDPAIAAPRRASPRLRVPGGSVGIAGGQTGVYPRQSPGGWQIIGRTALRMFDAARAQPALLAAGDSVRFVPVDYADVVFGLSRTERTDAHAAGAGDADGGRHVTVLRPGLFTTVQDLGRWGHQGAGVPVSGAMDSLAHRAANSLLGNDEDAATLEATIVGPDLRLDHDVRIVIAGADLAAAIDGAAVPLLAPVTCRSGSVLQFGRRTAGARAYVAFEGGVAVPRVLGSRATHVLSGIGGVEGRALVAGDRLPIGPPHGAPARRATGALPPRSPGGARVRVMPGPQDEWFPPAAYEQLGRTRFAVGVDSDRMGYRLASPAPIPRLEGREMITDPTFAGGVQVPPSGQPILLLADRQTSGGYPQIATVITADLPSVGQLAPGDWIEFEVCSRAEAVAALAAQEVRLGG